MIVKIDKCPDCGYSDFEEIEEFIYCEHCRNWIGKKV
jgi:predicted Zn-ribbon and HTH transcriptional regulator